MCLSSLSSKSFVEHIMCGRSIRQFSVFLFHDSGEKVCQLM